MIHNFWEECSSIGIFLLASYLYWFLNLVAQNNFKKTQTLQVFLKLK
jgi:hypothetical protein